MRKFIAVATAAAALAGLSVPAVANAATTTSNSLSYEFDNGNFGGDWYWELQKNSSSLNTTFDDHGYADAGVVVDLGLANDFTGIDADASSSMTTNIWIGDGAKASTPGQYNSADFSYGFQQPDGSFWMTSGPYAGQILSADAIAADFAGDEVYAWVGLVYSGSSVSGSVSAVNGQSTGNRTVSFTNNGDNTVTVAVH